ATSGSVGNPDAFAGMVCEPHLPGSELGELQNAIWTAQFTALRDGDRFFYANDDYLNNVVVGQYGIDYRQTLAQVIATDSNANVQANVFKAPIQPGADSVGLVASYGFDEGAGSTAHDSSGRGDNGNASNTVWTAGKSGPPLGFNGASSWVTIASSGSLDLTTGMTLEAWVKPTTLGSLWRAVIFKERSGLMDYSLYANDGKGHPSGQVCIGREQDVFGPSPL